MRTISPRIFIDIVKKYSLMSTINLRTGYILGILETKSKVIYKQD